MVELSPKSHMRVSYSSKANTVYQTLREQILAGALAPGIQLNQAKLAAELDVSATPLREALRRLEADGLVRTRTYRDAVVAPYDHEEAQSLFAIRQRLGRLAARLAATNLDQESRTRIETALKDLHKRGVDPLDASRAFQRAVYLASGNQVLTDVLDGLWVRYDRYRRLTRGIVGTDVIIAQHEALAQAIFDRDAERADRLMAEHIKSAEDVISDELRRIGLGRAEPRASEA